jgi:hypothetical protein
MNANELAEIMDTFYRIEGKSLYNDIATMLRQQHTSLISDVEVIERLAKEIQVKDEAIFNSEKQAYNLAMQVQNQQAEIEALKKEAALQRLSDFTQEAECKPVAWAYIKDGEFWDAIHPDEHAQEEGSYTIPLYTHPVKEYFEDEPQAEELHEILQSNANPVKELTKNITGVWRMSDQSIQIVFTSCRSASEFEAILRKAQEK